MSVFLNVVIVLGIVTAGSFILFFVGDFFFSFSKKKAVENRTVLQIEHKSEPKKTEKVTSVYVTDYIPEEVKEEKQEKVEEVETAENDEERRIAEARAALERRKAEILKRMQAQINEDDEEDDEEEEQEDAPVSVGVVNTDEVTVEEESQDSKESVDAEALQAEIEQLKNQLGVEREKYDALTKELENRPQVQTVVEVQKAETLGSKEHYENMLEDKLATLKVVEKEYKQCKKDFIPLYKVHNTLAKDEKKLHRKEAIVAKQKVVLYGVNNYADIDEEKAKKLAEDLDLLDGLKLSVNHCKEVMAENKDRYPILERLYNTLKTQVTTLKSEIESIKTILEGFETEGVNNNQDSVEE